MLFQNIFPWQRRYEQPGASVKSGATLTPRTFYNLSYRNYIIRWDCLFKLMRKSCPGLVLELHVWYQGCDLINSIQGHPPSSCHLCVTFRDILTWRILTLFLHASNRIPDHNWCPLLTQQENYGTISVIFIGSMIEPHFTHHTVHHGKLIGTRQTFILGAKVSSFGPLWPWWRRSWHMETHILPIDP